MGVSEALQVRCGSRVFRIGERTYIMGILNVTPDSFSGDGLLAQAGEREVVDLAVARAREMVAGGADLLDVGGESSRPGSDPVPLEEELRRVIPVIERLSKEVDVPLSIDTCKAEVARQAIAAGASMVNDISALRFDPEMAPVVARAGVPVVLMHMKGTPKTMQQDPHYDDVVAEVIAFLQERIAFAVGAGIGRDQIIVDPGFGFGKTVQHNLEILRRLGEMRVLGRPILIGTSRKSTIGKVLGDLPVEERLEGTAATVALAIAAGADFVRVHDVRPMARVARMADAIVRGWEPVHG
jgi:dihydropteroate synthase